MARSHSLTKLDKEGTKRGLERTYGGKIEPFEGLMAV
jgi:hypothetical protein